MRDARAVVLALVMGSVGLLPRPVSAGDGDKDHQHQHALPERLGTVTFPTSCAKEVQAPFTRAVALLHSFWYGEANKAFAAVAAADPSCAMAHWGVAMTWYRPIWAPPTPDELDRGRRAVALGKAAGPKTDREKDYLGAVSAFFDAPADATHGTRALAYEKAMAALHARYPEDREAAIFYALALLGTAPPADKTYANQRKAGEILNRLLPGQPDHPGVSHYLIHSFDYPQLADLALGAARSYAKIAESSPHALHMPSHIFVRLGLWDDAIRSNQESAAAARAHAEKTAPGAFAFDELHALDYLTYGFVQQARDEEAAAALARMRLATRVDNANLAAAYALAAAPARFALERSRWAEAAELTPFAFPWQDFPQAESITHLARAIGAARTGNTGRAREALARLTELHAAAEAARIPYWPGQIAIQRAEAEAWVAFAEGRHEDALALMKKAVEAEAATDKHAVTPGPVLPAAELYGDLLMELGRPGDALAHYEASLALAPNRLRPLASAVRAAEAAAQPEKARAHFATLAKVAPGAGKSRPELAKWFAGR